ncbi:PREDICTED: TMV resistance protein N-like [Camelina sativa]|uniref:TMV resistance protein N-like n=1 Tax=Camelina sativa TaxID=90675 RepID=A0ABM0WBU7_CAMSA|nr:PREDICTED: TMV resistance protein N-like [Camelina sativa]
MQHRIRVKVIIRWSEKKKDWSLKKKKNSMPKMKHDVFISFRSKDTRDNFVSHLSGCLRRKRIKTFLYDELPNEERYEGSLKAIEVSRISVIVFSENFGDSKWCLDEVVTILKCKERFGQIVIPVLYHVDPLDIENQTGSFGDAFGKRRDKPEQLQEWKDGFEEAINLPGWSTAHLRNEEMLVNQIARDIENKLLRASRAKVIIEWSLVIANLILEIASSVVDQISSPHKPLYALAAMSMSLLSCILCLVDLLHKGRVERVLWKWTWPIPWFYYPTQRSHRFGSFPEMVGLLCALCQTTTTAVSYSFITHGDDSPIKFSIWPVMFALGLLCSLLIKRS